MAKQNINVGDSANDKKGDSLRSAFQKVNANFTELYTALGLDSEGLNLGAFQFSGSTLSTTDSSSITIAQSVTVNSNLNVGGDLLPVSPMGGNLGSSANPWHSLYVSNNTIFIGGTPLAINQSGQLTINGSQVGGSVAWNDVTGKPNIPSVADFMFVNSTMSAGNEDEIIVQAKDTSGFSTAKLNLEPVYGTASLSAYSTETVETFTLANGDFATGVWQNNGYNNGVIAFTGAQNIGDFFQNTLMSLTSTNVSITINSQPAFTWNGGTSGAGSSTPGLTTGALFPASPLTITSIVFRYRTQSTVSVNQDNTEIRLTAQNASIEMSADLNVRMFADDMIEIQSGENLTLSSGQDISISTASSDLISISTGDLNITAFDDVNFRGSDSFRIRNTSASAPIRIITDDNNTQKTWAFNPSGDLTLPGNLQSESDISIEINLTDSTRRIWRFGEDGELTFPDGTAQDSAGISATSTNTLTNKTINIQAGQGNVFQIQGNSITSYSGSGSMLALTSMPTFSGMNVNNSSLSLDGGSGSYYWAPTFADGTGTIHKAGVYKSANNANNSLFTFGANGAGTMSVVMDGSLFVGSSLPSNNGGLNTNYGGWLVVQAGAKFGGDLNTIGNFILDTPGNYVRFGDGTTQTTAADFGYLDLDKDTIKGTAGYQYTFATDGYFTSSTSSESTNYFFVAYNTTNANIAAGWTVVGGTANTTVSSVTYPVAGYPGVIRVNLTAAASSTSGFYPVTVTSPDRLRVEIQPNPGTNDKFAFTTSGLTFPDATVQTTAFTTSPTLEKITGLNQEVSMILDPGANKLIIGPGTWDGSGYDGLTFTHNADYSRIQATGNDTGGATRDLEIIGGVNLTFSTNWAVGSKITLDPDGDGIIELKAITNVTGILKIDDGVHEKFQAKADATGVVTHDCTSGHVFYHTSPDADWTANFTNLNLSSNYATAVTLIIVQGGTGYYPSAVQIDGVGQTLNWQGNATPTPSTNRTDVVTFSILNNSGTYTVLGQLTGF